MAWDARDESGAVQRLDGKKAADYEKAKAEGLPVVEKEAESGVRPFESVKFQPVISPGIYEAEFGVKGRDLIFHFWPDGYHKAERNSQRLPTFKKDFLLNLEQTMGDVFGSHRIQVQEDLDVGAIFVQAHGWGENDNVNKVAINACEKFHKAMGGLDG